MLPHDRTTEPRLCQHLERLCTALAHWDLWDSLPVQERTAQPAHRAPQQSRKLIQLQYDQLSQALHQVYVARWSALTAQAEDSAALEPG